jgi:glycosyltransferase involved in cell wall biosynthesis
VAIAGDPNAVGRGLAVSARPAHGARVGAVGISVGEPCGVHDHAVLLADTLAETGFPCTQHWLWRTGGAIGGERAEVRSWIDEIAGELAREHPAAVLLHYSVFAFSHRGVPVFVRPVVSALRHRRLPVVTLVHEFAYPWRLGGARGKVWAATQRAALIGVMRVSAAVVVTGEARADWLRTRAWLPRRPTAVAPVFSNLPAPATASRASAHRLGLFGYAHEGVDVATVLGALGALRGRTRELELVLLGAPGAGSVAGARWQRAAAERGVARMLSFSGRLPAQELSDALARCAVLLFAERGGPTSRKTTLAASLSSGRPVVALDGRNSWRELREAEAAVVVKPDARALADAIAGLLDDEVVRERQGARGREFARRAMSVSQSARIVGGALARAIDESAR